MAEELLRKTDAVLAVPLTEAMIKAGHAASLGVTIRDVERIFRAMQKAASEESK